MITKIINTHHLQLKYHVFADGDPEDNIIIIVHIVILLVNEQ